MTKLRYEVDPHNRLVLKGAGERSGVNRFRRVLDGAFKIGGGNSLLYHIKAPAAGFERGLKLPHQVRLDGKWSLTKNHDLKLTLNNWRRQALGDELTLAGQILQAQANSLLFVLTTRTRDNRTHTNILKLQGRWQADKCNRLEFELEKSGSSGGALTLGSAWEVNKRRQLVYRYQKAAVTGLLLSRRLIKGDGEAFVRLFSSRSESGVNIGLGRRW